METSRIAGRRPDALVTPAAAGPRDFRRCLGRFSTGVTVVTYQTDEGVRGTTVNSFSSVSIEPPLVMISLARTARICAAVERRPFAINVLRSDQMDIAFQFAGRGNAEHRIRWEIASYGEGVPTMADSIAVFVCEPWRRYDGGDHILQLGEVVGVDARPGEPLVFSDGRFMTSGLPMLDGPLVHSLDSRPVPKWVGAVHRLHHQADAG